MFEPHWAPRQIDVYKRQIPNLVYDESNVEDIDTRQEDHIYDECRYVLMENPISPPVRCAAPVSYTHLSIPVQSLAL